MATRPEITEALKDLILSKEQQRDLCAGFRREFNKGLKKDTNDNADIKMFPTYVQDLPTGKEEGKFLALDLGGTNFRILLIECSPHNFRQESKIYVVPNQIMTGPGTQLFDHIANCLAEFVDEYHDDAYKLPLGFTFSFPCRQDGLTKASLVRWTKGFNCSGVVDHDVVQLLREAVARRGDIRIDVVALVNDTTGTLMSCAYTNPLCRVGLIVGTGTNICYSEKVDRVELLNSPAPGKKEVIVNTEWGAYGETSGALELVRTEFDKEIDLHSVYPNKQIFEKMISGMYMGEIARLALVKLTKLGLIFGGRPSNNLLERDSFFSKYLSEIESDDNTDHSATQLILEELGIVHATREDCENVRYVCQLVSTRAAKLVSCGVATLIDMIDEPFVIVGVDGSVYRFHPHFHNLMTKTIGELVKPGIKFELMLSEDGSGKGAALVAAVAAKHS